MVVHSNDAVDREKQGCVFARGHCLVHVLGPAPYQACVLSTVFFEGGGSLTDRWELADSTRHGSFLVRPHKPLYFLLANWCDNPNKQPDSGNPETSLPVPVPLQAVECKFQFSFKFKVWEGIFGKHGDLWLAYSQSSRWQVYNSDLSRLFRETNYEPEVLLNFATDVKVLGFKLRMLGGGLNHQSNGRSYFLTRSWNRVLLQIGFERPHWTVVLRPWMRLPEEVSVDENPNVERYIGRGDLLVVRTLGHHELSFLGRHSLDLDPGSWVVTTGLGHPGWPTVQGACTDLPRVR